MEYFSDSLILYTLRKYSQSYKEIEQTAPKIYFVDNGLLVVNEVESLSRFMENVVFLELVRRNFTPNSNLFYFSLNNKEVDFILKKGEKITQMIQVCYSIEDFNTKERELSALLKASEKLKCNNLLVITWNYEDEEKINNKKIVYKTLWKWLLKL